MTHTDSSRMPLSSRLLLSGTTALALAFMAPQVFAQNAPGEELSDVAEEDVDEVVATGIRQALKAARDLKRNADTAVDSITASDVSTLPDLSVAEALARIPGVVVQRIGLGASEGDFPSPEGGENLVRGLTLVRSEFNGREAFSANGGRALDFGTVPPELIGAVDVYKNNTADMIEGGIGGTINLRTLEPFDRSGRIAVFTADATYTDLRDEWAGDFSAILGDRWTTDMGEFGLLGSISSSELKSDLNGFQLGMLNTVTAPNGETVAIPAGFQLRTNEVDRERESYYLAGQYRNNDGTFEATAKYNRIDNESNSNERTLEWFSDAESFGMSDVTGLAYTPFTSAGLPQCNGSNEPTPEDPTCEMTNAVTGLYESGLISNNLRDWTGAAGAGFTNLGISQQDTSQTTDVSLNVKWRPSDQWFVQLDGHKTTAELGLTRLWAGTRFFSDFNLNADLDDPYVTLVPDPASNPSIRGSGVRGNPLDLTDPANSYLLFAADEFNDNEGDMYAIRGDVEYEFDNDGWFDSIKFGARIAEREQTNRQAGLNWAAVAAPWAGDYLPYSEVSGQTGEIVDFADFFRGGVVRGPNTSVVFADRSLLQDYDAFVSAINGESLITQGTVDGDTVYGDWRPLRQNGVVDYAGRGNAGTVTEKTQNLYARFDFGNEFDNGMSIDANVGIRYIRTEVDSVGELVYNENLDNATEIGDPPVAGPRPSDFSPEAIAFTQQPNEEITLASTDERWLPSLNVKWNLNDNSLIRFGISKAITRPNIFDLRADRQSGVSFQFVRDPAQVPGGPSLPPLDIRPTQVSVSGGNPSLEPITSVNADLSYELYFGDENSFTFAVFHKDLKNNIVYGSQTLDTVQFDGDTIPVVYNGNLNQDEATIKGFEAAYQQFYTFLPGFLSNLGLQANYTYIDAETSAPPGIVDADNDGVADDFGRIYRYGVTNYLGLSEHAANVIGIYQSDKFEFRLAYNWRSEYLSSYRDFVTGNPVYQDDRGYLDGSIKYDFNDQFQIRFQVANILDTRANAFQQIDASGQQFGRTSFIQDRRVRIGARYAF